MIVPTPASIDGRYGARWTRRSVASSTWVLPWSSFIVIVLAVALVAERGRALLVFAGLGAGAAVADEMLGTGDHGERIAEPLALQAAGHRFAELGDHVGIFGEAFVRAAPALVARHRDARGERPLDAGGANLLRP